MIILKHLTVERFRLLREVNLHFPQRGSILIQGPNEAGKSTLFESIYFALYGEPLATERSKRVQGNLDDLVHYGENDASVMLVLSISATELTITRTIERGKGQKVSLVVRRLGMPEENVITNLAQANARIVSELGQIDSKTLRNSCLIEQKGLERVERLSGQEREAILRKLLGLTRFERLAEQFKLTGDDEQRLVESTRQLELAEVQARIPELSAQLGKLEVALDAIGVSEVLAEVNQQEVEIAEQQLALEQVAVKRDEIKARQSRIQQLKKANATLGEIITAYDAIAEAQREIPELERQITELERREREELPALEQRVRELADLGKSFGTLERMASDLLAAVNTIKELEQEMRAHDYVQETIIDLDGQIEHARLLVDEAMQSQHEVEEQNRSGKPKLEARLQRLQALAEKLAALKQAEVEYERSEAQVALASENSAALRKVWRELQETEQELQLVEKEAKQVQARADAVEMRWRQLSIRQQLVEWERLKGLTQGLVEAQQHVMEAHQYQAEKRLEADRARSAVAQYTMILVGSITAFVVSAGGGGLLALYRNYAIATVLGLVAILAAAAVGWSFMNLGKARTKEQEAERIFQDAVSRTSMMSVARETAARMGGDLESLARVEHEILALGGAIPSSVAEAQQILEQPQEGQSVVDVQQQAAQAHDEVTAARNQVNVTMEAVAALRKEYTRLQDQRKKEDWDVIDEKLRTFQSRIEQLRAEVASAAGQEGLPIPTGQKRSNSGLKSSSSATVATEAELKAYVHDAVRATEREIAMLEGKLGAVPDLEAQVKIHQEALDVLMTRRKALAQRHENFMRDEPLLQIERARAQQSTLRDALKSLQDSLRLRVLPLGVSFGQASISAAEIAARRQLELLHITLGNRVDLQNRHESYATLLKQHQEALADHYRQLAKYSSALGSWIVPLNPFAEALVTLRLRCEREMAEANEHGIADEFENLNMQEGALNAKIALCHQEIEEAHERILALLKQRNRPAPKGYTFTEIAVVWPLVSEYSPEDRVRLEDQLADLEQQLHDLEQQEMELSRLLQTGGSKLDLEQARKRMEQQERTYQTKKHGSLLLQTVIDRLMHKMLPRIEYCMQHLLPQLTVGRYHDVRLSTGPQGTVADGALQLSIWEPAASEYIPRSSFSAGTADQISLALRLAFTIAALPRELSAAPGFVLLDEPLSSFSRERMQALVDIVTGEALGQHFEQVLFVSHSSAFDPAMFPYHIYVDDGQVVESNLPVVTGYMPAVSTPTPQETPPPDEGEEEDEIDARTVKIPVPSPVAVE